MVAPNATFLDIAALEAIPDSDLPYMENLLSNMILAYDHLRSIIQHFRQTNSPFAMVISNSWAMYSASWDFPVGSPGNYSENPNHPFNRLVGVMDRLGADIVFSAGNCGKPCPDVRCGPPGPYGILGANSHPQVLTAGAVDIDQRALGYSSSGPGALSEKKPNLCGYSHFKGSGVYETDSGTSVSCPIAAGVVAAIRTQYPFRSDQDKTSPAVIRNLLTKTAIDHGLTGFDYQYGWGVLSTAMVTEFVRKHGM
jgi:subtilisin family serine protease